MIFTPGHTHFGNDGPAFLAARNQHPYISFATTGVTPAYFEAVMPANYASGHSLNVYIHASSAGIADPNEYWVIGVAFEKMDGLDIDSDSFDTADENNMQEVESPTGTVIVLVDEDGYDISVTYAKMDGIIAGDAFRLHFYRDADNVDDVGDVLQVHAIELREN